MIFSFGFARKAIEIKFRNLEWEHLSRSAWTAFRFRLEFGRSLRILTLFRLLKKKLETSAGYVFLDFVYPFTTAVSFWQLKQITRNLSALPPKPDWSYKGVKLS